ncbi:hypothetical protein F5Y03DRAFT_321994 [Xylaria venustula]|nr:hypothetical protein F5Y03DRAFT_321994 [Xylaria venustula]
MSVCSAALLLCCSPVSLAGCGTVSMCGDNADACPEEMDTDTTTDTQVAQTLVRVYVTGRPGATQDTRDRQAFC